MTTMLTFGQVTMVIQSALSKVTKVKTLTLGTIPSDVEMSINAIQHQQLNDWYEPPHKCQGDTPHQPSGKFSVEKAAFYCGKGHTNSLM
jgi:hypothetical protein